MKKIVFLDQGTLEKQKLTFDFPFEMTNIYNCPANEVAKAINDHEIVITNKVPITRETMEKNPQLKLIAVSATGFNVIDIEAATDLGITVCNVADYSTIAVAEHAFMMMIALVHRLPIYQRLMNEDKWQKSEFYTAHQDAIFELHDKTLGIVGKGNIGSQLATYAKAFGMKVLFSERKGADTIRDGYTSFDEVLKTADVYSIHTPMTAETNNMITKADIAMMKDGVIIINVSRGGLVNEADLADALREGKVGGAGLDVLSTEPPAADNPLLAHDLGNFILTPHTGWGSEEAIKNLIEILENNINSFVKGKPINVVNG